MSTTYSNSNTALSPYLVRERHTRAISIIPPLRPPHKRLLHHRPQSCGQAPRIASQHATILRIPPAHLRRLLSSAEKPLPTQQRQPALHHPQHRIQPRHHHRPQNHRRSRVHHPPRPRARLRLRARPRPRPRERPRPRRQPPAVLAQRPPPGPARPLGREAPQPPQRLPQPPRVPHQHRQRREPRQQPRQPQELRPPDHHQVQAQQRPRRGVQVQQPGEAEHVPGADVGRRRADCDAHFRCVGFFFLLFEGWFFV
ncbi:hypothetical protein F4809DRAFT_660190 [Biscogniauxia mediterranea]|nr:hypothetical protein F4809DRAFT_660190 [Biscogniauxia mediterranea]